MIKAKVDRVNFVVKAFKNLEKKARRDKDCDVVVGFSQRYAIFVHEDLTANHPNGGQAKYLEQPARAMRTELMNIVKQQITRKVPLLKACLVAGYRLLREAQKLVPVDTGALRASGFVAPIAQAGQAAEAAFRKSEKYRK